MKKILDQEQIKRSINRISNEILERNENYEDLIFFGIIKRGDYIAKRLSKKIFEIEGINIPVHQLNTRMFRDDLSEENENSKMDLPKVDIKGKTVILVDDVMYTGRTARAAIDAIIKIGRPGKIQLVTLIDRGHRELPIRPDYVGKNIPTSRDEIVGVKILEIDGTDEVTIE